MSRCQLGLGILMPPSLQKFSQRLSHQPIIMLMELFIFKRHRTVSIALSNLHRAFRGHNPHIWKKMARSSHYQDSTTTHLLSCPFHKGRSTGQDYPPKHLIHGTKRWQHPPIPRLFACHSSGFTFNAASIQASLA